MRILCTNDDGYLSPGLRVLAEAAHEIGAVDVVAPDRERSASSHALTLHHPLRKRRAPDGTTIIDGTPTDCVMLAVNELLGERPGLCLSGVNAGPNMGEDVFYSGTVAAAMEAAIMRIPAVAVSFAGRRVEEVEGWQTALVGLLTQITARGIAAGEVLNVNLPPVRPDEARGVRVTELGRRHYTDAVTRAPDPSGREYYWIGGTVERWDDAPDSDFQAVSEGCVSVTPLHLDLTNRARMSAVREWKLEL